MKFSLLLSILICSSVSASEKLSAEESDRIRENWLNELKVHNQKNIEWLFSHDAKDFVGVEVLVSRPTEGPLESRWGHAFFRFVKADSSWLLDPVIGFVADVDGLTPSYIKGMFGGYQLGYVASSLGELWGQYLASGGRSIQRIPLLLNKEEISSIWQELKRLHQEPDEAGKYFFMSKNCASGLLAVLEKSLLLKDRMLIDIPTQLESVLQKHLLVAYPPLIVDSPAPLQKRLRKVLNDFESPISQISVPSNVADVLLSEFSVYELRVLFWGTRLPYSLVKQLAPHIRISKSEKGSRILKFDALPSALYQLCPDAQCFLLQNEHAQDYFNMPQNHFVSYRKNVWKHYEKKTISGDRIKRRTTSVSEKWMHRFQKLRIDSWNRFYKEG